MSQVLKAEIGAVDFGPEGENLVYAQGGITLHPTTGGAIDTATLRLRKPTGGAYTIKNAMPVKLWLRETTTNRAVWRFFIGVISRRRTSRVKGTNIKVWELDLQGANIAFDSCVTDAAWAPALHLAAGTFKQQLITTFGYFSTGADIPIDADTQVPELFPGVTLEAKVYQGYTLREVMQDIFDRGRAATPAVVPAGAIVPDPQIGAVGGGFGNPVLNVWDTAAAFSPRVQFSDVETGGYQAILTGPEFARIIESAQIVNFRESTPSHLVAVYAGDDPTSRAAYPNPFNGRHGKAWMGKPLKDDQSLDGAAAQRAIDNAVRQTANPRETLTFATFTPVMPGDFITISWSLDSLSDQPYVVSGVTINFEIPGRPVYVVTAGARLLGIGEVGDAGYPAPPAEGHAARPDPPGRPVDSLHTFNEATGRSSFHIAFTPSPSADVVTYYAYIVINGATDIYDTAGATAWDFTDLPPLTVVGVYVKAVDAWSNLSDMTEPISPTTAGPPAPAPPTGIHLRTDVNWGGFRWDTSGVVAAVGWTPNPAADHYDFELREHSSQRLILGNFTVAGDSVEVGSMSRGLPGGYDLRLRAATAAGNAGTWSDPLLITPPAANPRYPGGLHLESVGRTKTGQTLYLLGWTVPPPTSNLYNGVPASYYVLIFNADQTEIVLSYAGIALTQAVWLLAPLPSNQVYWARVGTQEAYGDLGIFSPAILLSPAAPSVPDGGQYVVEGWQASNVPAFAWDGTRPYRSPIKWMIALSPGGSCVLTADAQPVIPGGWLARGIAWQLWGGDGGWTAQLEHTWYTAKGERAAQVTTDLTPLDVHVLTGDGGAWLTGAGTPLVGDDGAQLVGADGAIITNGDTPLLTWGAPWDVLEDQMHNPSNSLTLVTRLLITAGLVAGVLFVDYFTQTPPAAGGHEIRPAAIGNTQLDVITDPSRFGPETSAFTPFQIFDEGDGSPQVDFYASGAYNLVIAALNNGRGQIRIQTPGSAFTLSDTYGATLTGAPLVLDRPAQVPTRTITGTTTLAATDQRVFVSVGSSTSYTITLPPASSRPATAEPLEIIATGVGIGGSIILAADGTAPDNIEGAASVTLTAVYQKLFLASGGGTRWYKW